MKSLIFLELIQYGLSMLLKDDFFGMILFEMNGCIDRFMLFRGYFCVCNFVLLYQVVLFSGIYEVGSVFDVGFELKFNLKYLWFFRVFFFMIVLMEFFYVR